MTSSTTWHMVEASDLRMCPPDAYRVDADKSIVTSHSRSGVEVMDDTGPSSDQPQGERQHPSAPQDSALLRRGPEVDASASKDDPQEPSFEIRFVSDDDGRLHELIIAVFLLESCGIAFEVYIDNDDPEVFGGVRIRVRKSAGVDGNPCRSVSVKATFEEWANVQPDDVEALLNLVEPLVESFESSGKTGCPMFLLNEDCIPEFVAKRLAEGSEQ